VAEIPGPRLAEGTVKTQLHNRVLTSTKTGSACSVAGGGQAGRCDQFLQPAWRRRRERPALAAGWRADQVTAVRPDGGYLAESYRDRLPKASIGKSCVRFKRLGDLDQDTLEALVREAAQLTPPT
jgi:hypothetical protein